MNRTIRTALLHALGALPLLAAGASAAQVAPAPVSGQGTRATRLAAKVEIVDGVATTSLSHVLHNDGHLPAEAIWILPLPPGAVADGLRLTANGVQMESDVLDKDAARGVYEDIVRRRRDPALLEYAGRGCLRARVFPIPPQGDVTVEVVFRQVLPELGGLRRWSLALNAAGLDGLPPEQVVLDLALRSRRPIKNAFSPQRGVRVTQSDDYGARASFEGRLADLETGELALFYGLSDAEFGLDLLTHRAAGADEGTFLMLLSPKRDWDAVRVLPKEVVVVVDVSGSMAGRKLEQAKGALEFFLGSLRDGDRFNVVPFATEAEPFFPACVEATPANREAALAKVARLEASGGTNIHDALVRALPRGAGDGERVPLLVLLTDGLPTVGVTEAKAITDEVRRQNERRARLFVLGVGNDVDTFLLDTLSGDSGGARDYVRESEDIEEKASALLTKLAHPVLTDLELAVDGIELGRVVPARLPDLFRGERLTVLGRYRGEGPRVIRLTGTQQGERRTYVYEASFAGKGAEEHDFVPSLWAERRVGVLLDALRLNGPSEELLEEIVRLGNEYRIVTPYTSHLVLEEGLRTAAGGPLGGPSSPGSSAPRGAPSGPMTGGGTIINQPTSGGDDLFLDGGSAGRDGAPNIDEIAAVLRQAGALPEESSEEALRVLALEVAGELRNSGEELKKLGQVVSGEGAVGDSAYLAALIRGMDGTNQGASSLAERLTRRIRGKNFGLERGVWTDRALDPARHTQRVVVEAFSPAYFELLRTRPELAPYFAFSTRLVVVLGDQVFEVRPPAEATPAPAPAR